MRSPCVRLILKGQTLAEIPFERDALRIGRMKENDVVIHNLSVSRFHATLTREGDGFVIQDSGSENGIYVNGERTPRSVVGPNDHILIGKHQLEILLTGTSDAEDRNDRGSAGSDAWDASSTYFVGADTQRKMLEGASIAHDADTDGEAVDDPSDDSQADDTPDTVVLASDEAEPTELFGSLDEGDLLPDPTSEFDVSAEDVEAALGADRAAASPQGELAVIAEPIQEPTLDAAAIAVDEPAIVVDEPTLDKPAIVVDEPTLDEPAIAADESTLDEPAIAADESTLDDATVAIDADAAALLDGPTAPVPVEPDAPATDARAKHAGLIVSRRGRFERVLSWDAPRLCLGRAVECDVVLSAAEVSRNHSLLVFDGERYEVRDLESINGTWVNGEKISRRTLEVGDVIRVDEFELTFVLEDGPIGDEIVAQAPEQVQVVPSGDARAFTQLGEMLDLAPFDVGGSRPPSAMGDAMSFDDAQPQEEPATVLIHEPSVDAPAEAGPELDAKPETDGVWALELRIRMEELPEALREALRTLEEAELRLPVELSLKTRES
jgi:pSer/pThr/pTyr-binding forkhead associated (FHA) protein